MTFNPKKPCQTRDGRPVVIKCTDWPSNGILGHFAGHDVPIVWSKGGLYLGENFPHENDLINTPKPKGGWVVLHSGSPIYDSKRNALANLPSTGPWILAEVIYYDGIRKHFP